MVAVTGTNGKTTTATLAAAVLAGSGLDSKLAGNADIAPPLSTVTGDPDAEPDLIVCEVSSFQLECCPTLMPEVAVFTNLSHDHLPRHGTMRRYGEVKRSLFIKDGVAVPLAVVDTIDEFGHELAGEVERAGGRAIRVGLGPEAAYRITGTSWDLRRAELELETPSGRLTLETRLPGYYNARNVAAVVALADALEVERSALGDVLATHPGARARFEHVDCGQPVRPDPRYRVLAGGGRAVPHRGAGGNGPGGPSARGAGNHGYPRPRSPTCARPRREVAVGPIGPHRRELSAATRRSGRSRD